MALALALAAGCQLLISTISHRIRFVAHRAGEISAAAQPSLFFLFCVFFCTWCGRQAELPCTYDFNRPLLNPFGPSFQCKAGPAGCTLPSWFTRRALEETATLP